ncbi:MAG: lipid-A-disaccharide synthase [Thermoanaerobaculia bacterium]|nr:lipid-A-disaccharide synthase [Thermoanaerobaculia bacterium]
MAGDDLLIVAGEASGDLHGARLLTALRQRVPSIRAFGLAGDELREAGTEAVADASEIAVVGIAEVLKILPRAREIFAQLLEEAEARGAKAAVLIDSPEFNLRMARELSERGVRVLYYVSPQVWAWRKGRIRQIVRYIDTMLVLFPFEEPFYRSHGVEVVHVGHPLVDEVPELEHAWDHRPPSSEVPVRVVLLPGSRNSEVRALLPRMRGAVEELADKLARDEEASARALEVRLIQAPGVAPETFDALLDGCRVDIERVPKGRRYEVIADSHLALCASGTATVEVGLLGTPMLVLYRLKWSSYWLGKLLIDLPHVCMVNLVLEKRVVPEMIQRQAEPGPVSDEAMALLRDPDRIDEMRRDLQGLRGALGSSGASERAAEAIARRLADLGVG